MILIYTDKKLIEECENRNYLFPLLKLLVEDKEELKKEYQICEDIQQSHIAFFPIAVDFFLKIKSNKQVFQNFVNLAINENKKIVVFTSGDIGFTFNHPLVYTLRLGGFASKIKEKGWIMPPFIKDPYLFLSEKETYLKKETKPEIGFVGQSNGSVIKLIKDLVLFFSLNLKRFFGKVCLDYQSFYPSSFYRHQCLLQLQKNKGLTTHFIFRKKYRAGVKNEIEKRKTSIEFYENMCANLYTFCMRGGGNFSVRLYETLAMGRIPIILNTDCKFPFENNIDWYKNCIIVEEREKKMLSQKVLEYHNQYSNEEIISIQKENRKLWEAYFTEVSFFLNFKNELLKII